MFGLPLPAHRWLGLDGVVTFWVAYVLTRPLGASFADWMGIPNRRGGLDWGMPLVAVLWSSVIVVFLACLELARRDDATRRTVTSTC